MRNVRITDLLRPIALLVCLMAVLCGCGSDERLPVQSNESTQATTVQNETSDIQTQLPQETETTAQEENLVEVVTTYLNMRMPENLAKLLRWEEIAEGDAHMTVCFLDTKDSTRELYRICFGAEYAESSVGTWNVDGEKIPLAVFAEVPDMSGTDDEQMLDDYSYAMESLQYVMSAIRDDARFQREEEVTVQKSEAKASYWEFAIPENMECVEEMTENNCKLLFYGTVNGERYLLYMFCVGEKTLANILGTFQVDGTARQVSVESCEPPSVEGWPEAEATKLYVMMDSINDMIGTIMESDGFAVLEAE